MSLQATAMRTSAVAAVLLMTLAGCAPQAAEAPAPEPAAEEAEEMVIEISSITLTSQPNETGFPVWLAQELGYFEENALDVKIEYAASGAAALAAGAAGDWEAGWTGGPPALTGINAFGLIMAGPEISENDNHAVWARTDALGTQTPAEFLQSAAIGVPANSVGLLTLIACAESYGLTLDQLNVVNLDPPSGIQAIMANQIQGLESFSSVDWPLAQEPENYTVICTGGEAGLDLILPYILTPKFVEEDPGAAARFLEAVYRAQEYINSNRNRSIDYLQGFYQSIGLEGGSAKAEYALNKRIFYSLDEALESHASGETEQALAVMAEFFVGNQVLSETPDIASSLSAGLAVLQAAKEFRDAR